VESHTTEAFRGCLASAREAIQAKAAVRIDRDWRALGVLKETTMVWIRIGPHADYERMLAKL